MARSPRSASRITRRTNWATSSTSSFPRVGQTFAQFGNIGVVESVKAVSELFTPIGGEIVETNAALESDPALLNRDPLGGGWLIRVRIADASERDNLLTAQEYEAFTDAAA